MVAAHRFLPSSCLFSFGFLRSENVAHLGQIDQIDHDLDHLEQIDQIDHRSSRTDRSDRSLSRSSSSSSAVVRGFAGICAVQIQPRKLC